MANIVISNVTSNSVTAYIAGLDTSYSRNDRYVSWNAIDTLIPVSDASGTSYLNAYVSQGGEITLSGLRSNIVYVLQAVVNYTNGGVWERTSLFDGFTTTGGGGTAILVIDSVTSNSVTMYVAQLDTGYSRNDRFIEWRILRSSDGFPVGFTQTNLSAYVSQSAPVTMSNLDPMTEYYAFVGINYTDGGVWKETFVTDSFTTIGGGGSRPPLFYWSNYGASPTSSTTTLFLPRATALNGLSTNIREVQAYKSRPQTSFPTIYTGQSFINLINQQAEEINTLNGWAYLSTIPTNGAPSSNYMLNMQTYINNIT